MTSTAVDQDGNEVYKKETYPGFFALQKSFFLQHYGLPSQQICKEHSLLRPQRQECGFIAGASMLNRNYYDRFISVKIYLDDFVEYANHITPNYLFPSKDEDSFFAELLKVKKDKNLNGIVPFELKN